MQLLDEYRAYTVEELNMYPYRALQQLSKMMALPSNVKKVVLIELIHARTMKSPAELEAIIQRVKRERQKNAQANRRKATRKLSEVQAMEVSSSTKTLELPPRDPTPDRSVTTDAHPRPMVTYRSKHTTSPRNTNSSDRVLRSYNVKTYKRPNYSLINNSMFGLVRAVEKAEQRKSQRVSHERRPSRHNVTPRCVNKKSRPRIIDCFSLLRKDTSPTHVVLANTNPIRLVPSYRNQSVQVHSSLLKPAHRNQLAPACSNQLAQAYSNQMVAYSRQHRSELSRNLLMTVPAKIPARRNARHLSICSISTSEMPISVHRDQIQSIGFRGTDGKLSKINALVQKPVPKISYTDAVENAQVTVQDIINSNIDAETFTDTSTSEYYVDLEQGQDLQKYYPNMAALTDVLPDHTAQFLSPEPNTASALQVYYRKKIRVEQVRKRTVPESPEIPAPPEPALPNIPCHIANEQNPPIIHDVCSSFRDVNNVTEPVYYVRVSEKTERGRVREGLPTISGKKANEPHLPKIHDAFSKFNDVNHVTQPIYVHVSEESEKTNVGGATNCGLPAGLELVYNYRLPAPAAANPAAPAPAPAPASKPARTTSVYSAHTVPTAMQQASFIGTALFTASCEQDKSSFNYTRDELSRELAAFAEQEMTLRKYHNALKGSTDTLLSQEFDPATIPEMVADALELISQDGDYMERINMDVRMQCILCDWAGSKIVLDDHIRKEHSTDIIQQASPEWNVTFSLGSLATQAVWMSHVSEHEQRMYILSAHYRHPDCFMASLTTLTDTEPKMGTITVYNKVTGEPYIWHDQILELPSNMPYENEQNCLTVQLSQLDVLPNNSNLKLHNRALVANSPSKVVVVQPELDDIQITVFVKVHF